MKNYEYLRRELVRLYKDHADAVKQKPYITFVTAVGDQVVNTSALPYSAHFHALDNSVPTRVLTLDIGQKACSVSFGEKTMVVHTTLNKRPISVEVPYGHLYVVRIHGDPITGVELVPYFEADPTTPPDEQPPTAPERRRPELRIVK